MTRNPSHQHYVAPVAEREAQSPGQHHGNSDSYEAAAQQFGEQCDAWLARLTPEQRARFDAPDLTQQELEQMIKEVGP